MAYHAIMLGQKVMRCCPKSSLKNEFVDLVPLIFRKFEAKKAKGMKKPFHSFKINSKCQKSQPVVFLKLRLRLRYHLSPFKPDTYWYRNCPRTEF